MRRKTLHLALAAASACTIAGATVSLGAEAGGTSATFVGNDVANGSFATTAGWRGVSANAPVALSSVTGVTGVPGASTALDISAPTSTGSWGEVLGDLTSPTFIRAGSTYRVQVWVRSLQPHQTLGVLLANANYNDNPGDSAAYVRYGDTNWHLVSKTFVATTDARPDTKFYLGLPTNEATHWQVTAASVSVQGAVASPVVATTSAAPTPVAAPAASTPAPVLDTTTAAAPVVAPTTPTTAPAAPAVSGSSGQAMPVGDVPGFHEIFTDNFTTDTSAGNFLRSYGGKWAAYDGFRDTDGLGTYSANALSTSGGMLDIALKTVNGTPTVAAPVALLNGTWSGQKYGRYSVRFRADSLPGYKTAWLLWPDNNAWSSGEIDFPEGDLAGTINAFNHQVGSPAINALAVGTGQTYTAWHTSTTEWTPSGVKFYLDGALIGSSSVSPTVPMHMVLQTETDGMPSASTAGQVQVDWVAIWSYTG